MIENANLKEIKTDLEAWLDKYDLNVVEFTQEFVDAVREHYGEHLYDIVKSIINEQLRK